ncbi:LysR family transcriptional regulator [Methanocaldococcus villosus KIN24-T80]|uniref:LysR family transcriptional regulator n=1 Tax=Methanocaldococcus villosus KIN24-T80 TaxID=1069083 RepID=N6V3B6_9EURY|nr:selenium metabolism-associated LysR family transcriptional regulator [Methanocaldococcus villosus]ENN96753.1 LysR family transcriptional regulator [Methanocaldococcus villosus KIN24-T80]
MDPKVSYFQTFIIAAKTKSFSKAAKRLGITQGTVSNHIAALEKFFDAQLFLRTPEGVDLTPEGEILFERAEKILDLINEAKMLMRAIHENPEGVIRIYASTTPGEHVLPSIIKEYKNQYKNVDFEITITDSKNCYKALEEGLADIIAVGYLKNENYDYTIIGKDRLVLIVPPNHPFTKREYVRLEDILKEDFIDREEGSGTRETFIKALNEKGYSIMDLNIVMRLGSSSAVITAVSEGYGISIVSEIPAKKAENAGLVKIVPIVDFDVVRYLYLIKSKRPKNPSAVKSFWEFVNR